MPNFWQTDSELIHRIWVQLTFGHKPYFLRPIQLTILAKSKSSLKFIYSEKATKFCEIFTLLLTVCTVVKSKANISQNFVAFSEYMNFNTERGMKSTKNKDLITYISA